MRIEIRARAKSSCIDAVDGIEGETRKLDMVSRHALEATMTSIVWLKIRIGEGCC